MSTYPSSSISSSSQWWSLYLLLSTLCVWRPSTTKIAETIYMLCYTILCYTILYYILYYMNYEYYSILYYTIIQGLLIRVTPLVTPILSWCAKVMPIYPYIGWTPVVCVCMSTSIRCVGVCLMKSQGNMQLSGSLNALSTSWRTTLRLPFSCAPSPTRTQRNKSKNRVRE